MMCVEPARGIYAHIIGIDIVRTSENEFLVLEDNTRTPSGVSYMLENRETMMHMFPDLFARNRVAPVDNYPDYLLKTLESVAPTTVPPETAIPPLLPGLPTLVLSTRVPLARPPDETTRTPVLDSTVSEARPPLDTVSMARRLAPLPISTSPIVVPPAPLNVRLITPPP